MCFPPVLVRTGRRAEARVRGGRAKVRGRCFFFCRCFETLRVYRLSYRDQTVTTGETGPNGEGGDGAAAARRRAAAAPLLRHRGAWCAEEPAVCFVRLSSLPWWLCTLSELWRLLPGPTAPWRHVQDGLHFSQVRAAHARPCTPAAPWRMRA